MRPSRGVLAAAALLVATASVSSLLVAARASSPQAAPAPVKRLPPATAAGEIVLYGHVRSMTLRGRRFELRLDPALWLGGATANRAAIEDGVIRPGETVPNDYYVREEGRRLLTFAVPASARVTVLAFNGASGIRSTAIAVSELAQIVSGRNPKRRLLYAPKLGFWVRVATDTVRSLDQQYQP